MGEYSLRGGILDIYPFTAENPIRLEFWGDEIDNIRSFDLLSQRSVEKLDEAEICPAAERGGCRAAPPGIVGRDLGKPLSWYERSRRNVVAHRRRR